MPEIFKNLPKIKKIDFRKIIKKHSNIKKVQHIILLMSIDNVL